MKVYLLNLLLPFAGVYLAFRLVPGLPDTALMNFAVYLSIYILLWLFSFLYHRRHFVKVWKVVSLFAYFVKELMVANLRIAYDVITPKFHLTPGVIALPLDARTEWEITILANLISLTPGTLSIDVNEERTVLYVHALYLGEGGPEALSRDIKNIRQCRNKPAYKTSTRVVVAPE